MNPPITLPVLLLAASTVPAQINATFTSKTKMIAMAYFPTTGQKTAEIPINTDLTGGRSISVSNSAVASVAVGFSNTSNAVLATIRESGTGRYLSSSTRAFSSTGSHQTLLTLRSAKPTKAILRASWSIRLTGTRGAFASGFVDIGNNGSFEFSGSGANATKDIPVTIDSKGLSIATTTRGSASASSTSRFVSYFSTLSIQILPPETCLFFKHGASCGPTLSGANGFEDRVTISATGGVNSGTGMLILGVQRTHVSIPGTSCPLLVQPLVTAPVRFSATGTFALTGTLPPSRPFALPMQLGSFGTTLGTSNALTIICP